jgi:hypothetical protein
MIAVSLVSLGLMLQAGRAQDGTHQSYSHLLGNTSLSKPE